MCRAVNILITDLCVVQHEQNARASHYAYLRQGEKLSEDNKTKIEAGLEKLKEALKSADLAAIDTAMEEMNAAWQGASQEMYKDTEGAPAGAPGSEDQAGPEANAESDVSDVEFEEVVEDEKK